MLDVLDELFVELSEDDALDEFIFEIVVFELSFSENGTLFDNSPLF